MRGTISSPSRRPRGRKARLAGEEAARSLKPDAQIDRAGPVRYARDFGNRCRLVGAGHGKDAVGKLDILRRSFEMTRGDLRRFLDDIVCRRPQGDDGKA